MSSFCKRRSPAEWCNPEEFMRQSYDESFGEQCYLYIYLCASNDGTVSTLAKSQVELGASQRAYRIAIGLRPLQDPIIPFLDHAGDIQLLGTYAAQIGDSDLFFGRVVDPIKANIGLAQDWLKLYES
ncbi:hypothetical protein B7463_g8678, partial [Scytalidium lignicola]